MKGGGLFPEYIRLQSIYAFKSRKKLDLYAFFGDFIGSKSSALMVEKPQGRAGFTGMPCWTAAWPDTLPNACNRIYMNNSQLKNAEQHDNYKVLA